MCIKGKGLKSQQGLEDMSCVAHYIDFTVVFRRSKWGSTGTLAHLKSYGIDTEARFKVWSKFRSDLCVRCATERKDNIQKLGPLKNILHRLLNWDKMKL